jgi:hypothetical protein
MLLLLLLKVQGVENNMFGLGITEIVALIVIGGIVFFFGKPKIKEWLSLGKELKQEANEIKTNKA